MSDLIQLKYGARPWEPTGAEEDVRILDEYNVPLAGVFRQGGHDYLFVCAAGEEADANVWLYALLEDKELDRLFSARGNDVLAAMSESLTYRQVTAAHAKDCQLQMWLDFDTTDEKPGIIVRRFLKRLSARIRLVHEDIDHLTRDLSIDADEPQLSLT